MSYLAFVERLRHFLIDERGIEHKEIAAWIGKDRTTATKKLSTTFATPITVNELLTIAKETNTDPASFFQDVISTATTDPERDRLLKLVIDVMDSNDEGTKKALAQNIEMFAEKVRREADFLARIEKLERLVGQDPPVDTKGEESQDDFKPRKKSGSSV